MSKVIAKFQVSSKELINEGTEYEGYTIDMFAVYSGSEENKSFFKATPCGNIKLTTVNPEAGKQFEQGKEYYVIFEKAEPATA